MLAPQLSKVRYTIVRKTFFFRLFNELFYVRYKIFLIYMNFLLDFFCKRISF